MFFLLFLSSCSSEWLGKNRRERSPKMMKAKREDHEEQEKALESFPFPPFLIPLRHEYCNLHHQESSLCALWFHGLWNTPEYERWIECTIMQCVLVGNSCTKKSIMHKISSHGTSHYVISEQKDCPEKNSSFGRKGKRFIIMISL